MALDMRKLIEGEHGPLPPRKDRYRVGELIAHCQMHAPALEAAVWEVALDHERRAMEVAALEPGALAAVAGARRRGFATAIWSNNARQPTLTALTWSSSASPSVAPGPRARRRRWPTGCDRARSTRSSAKSICSVRGGCCAPRSRPVSFTP